MADTLYLEHVASPIGDLLVATLGDAVCAISFEGNDADTQRYLERRFGECAIKKGALSAAVRAALDGYFDGDMAAFDGLASAARGTEFQEPVWAALRTIPAGETRSSFAYPNWPFSPSGSPVRSSSRSSSPHCTRPSPARSVAAKRLSAISTSSSTRQTPRPQRRPSRPCPTRSP